MSARFIFTCVFLPFAIIIGEVIHHQGKKIVRHVFGEKSPVASALSALLRIGFYLVAGGLLLWNLGIGEDYSFRAAGNGKDQLASACLRLGISIFILGFLHGFNIVALSLFHRKSRAEPEADKG